MPIIMPVPQSGSFPQRTRQSCLNQLFGGHILPSCTTWVFWLPAIAIILVIPVACSAYEFNDKFSLSGILAGTYQYQDTNDDNLGRGAVPLQLEFVYAPGPKDIFGAKFGFAAGNGLNDQTGFAFSPYAADLEDDVRDINGRNRDYLLTAWYRHILTLGTTSQLAITGGIIDATDYLDENVFANDEYTQFMNEALVNGPNAFLPSYDTGGAFQWETGNFAVSGVFMHIGENDNGSSYNFYGLQLGYTRQFPVGAGNYRLMVGTTSSDFIDPGLTSKEKRACLLLSFDQQLGKIYGVWLRLGTQDDAAAISYKSIYSGGLNINGMLWNRTNDNVGIGYGFLHDGNLDNDTSQVLEAYARFSLNDYLALTLDIQYMKDEYHTNDTLDGFIYGIRATAVF